MSDGDENGRGFLGAGIAFPLGVDSRGQISMNGLEDHVRQSILLILQTARGERVMRPEFGAGIRPLVFSPVDGATVPLVTHEVKQALIRFEPRIEVLDVKVTSDAKQPGVLLIELDYRVRRTDTLFNLVYPFYLEKGLV
jgi:uncharacterized protein